jgi:hypothetical protein
MLIDAKFARARVCGTAFAIVVVFLLGACGGDSGSPVAPGAPPSAPPPPPPPPPPPAVPFVGNYSLHTISDSLLPHFVPHPSLGNFYVDSGHMKLESDMSYSYDAEGFLQGTQAVTATDTGTFTESGSTITFTSKFLHGQTFTAAASDTSLNVTMVGSLLASQDFSIPVLFLKKP